MPEDELDFKVLKYYMLLLVIPLFSMIILTFGMIYIDSHLAHECITNGMQWDGSSCLIDKPHVSG